MSQESHIQQMEAEILATVEGKAWLKWQAVKKEGKLKEHTEAYKNFSQELLDKLTLIARFLITKQGFDFYSKNPLQKETTNAYYETAIEKYKAAIEVLTKE